MTRPHGTPNFAEPRVRLERRADGSLLLSSPAAPAPHVRQVGVWLRDGAARHPDAVFLAERREGAWYARTYGQVRAAVDGLSARLLERDLSPERPLVILSDNSVDGALLMLAAMQVGVPAAPISPAYSLVARDLAKLRHCLDLVTPGLVFADDGDTYARALSAVPAGAEVLVSRGAGPRAARLGEWLQHGGTNAAVEARFASTGPDSIAKFLFTSGSTGVPKAVVNTQRMVCSNQAAIAQVWPFLKERPPLVVDWLPWSHTFGGNHNFHMVLANGGALYIDGGKPAPALIGTTAENLRSMPPTLYFNVPKGFGLLLPLLEADRELARRFLERLELIFYAGAALSQDLWQRLEALCRRELGTTLPLVSAWGSTETSPLVTSVHFAIPRAGVIGLPVPGVELKMVPAGAKLELRVKGPNVTPGYWRQPELSAAAFDDEGYYCIGDAGLLADPSDPSKGIVFDGRVAEDFKLSSGSWVNVGKLRVEAIAGSGGLLLDAVVCGQDEDDVRLLGVPDWSAVGALTADLGATATPAERLAHPSVRKALAAALSNFNRERERASERIAAVLLLAEPPSLDAGEITDKGYLNQAAVRAHRAALVQRLYDAPHDSDVLRVP